MRIKTGKLHREAAFDRATVNAESRTVELSFSSEDPYERYFGIEILDHSPEAVRLKRIKSSGPLLMDHNSRDQIGIIENVTIGEDRKGRATVRFGKSARAEEVFQDVLDGIRGNVSVGYIIHTMKQEEVNKDAPDVFRAMDWEPLEVSLVSVPADITVGVGRDNQNDYETEVIDNQEDKEMLIEKKNFENLDADKGDAAGAAAAPTVAPPPVVTPEARQVETVNVDKIVEEATRLEQERIREITSIGSKMGQQTLAETAISSGMSLDQFRGQVLDGMKPNSEVSTTDPSIGLTKKESSDFSIIRAINSILSKGDLSLAPFEKEASRAVEKKMGKSEEERRFSVPFDVLTHKRDLVSNIDPSGGYLVGVGAQGQSFIELLRNSMMVNQMGARILDGLVGDVSIPKQSGGATAYWVDEQEAPTESQQSFGQVSMSPKTIGAYTDISRRLLLQSSLDIESFVRQDLATVIALAMDLAAINGAGVNGEPKGILNVTGIGSVAGGTNGAVPTWAHIVDLEKEVSKDNALMGTMGYLSNSDIVGKMKQTVKATNTGLFIMTGPNGQDGFQEMNGYRVGVSNQVPNNLTKGSGTDLSAIIFGNWADLMIGYWGSADVQVDPYTGGLAGTVRVRILRDTDIQVRHAESFASMQDAITV